MSQQINLINPALRKTHDWLTATPLAIATGIMLAIVILATVSAKMNADARLAEAERSVATLKASQDRLLSLSKEVGELRPDQKLADELSNALTLLTLRTEVIAALEGGSFSNSAGFAEYLRGFARQAPSGLWLTGIVMGSGGDEMEIRGRMLNPAALPDYIQRLNSEKAFNGRSFSNLAILRPEPTIVPVTAVAPVAPVVPGTVGMAGVPAAVTKPSPFVEFILTATGPVGGSASAQSAAGFASGSRK